MKFPDLTPVLGEISWCAVGAAATRMYMPERTTDDLDVLISADDAQLACKRLLDSKYTCRGGLAIGGSKWVSPENFSLDVLYGDARWVPAALNAAATNRDGQGMPIIPLPYLILMKFVASRAQDVADITRMLGQATHVQIADVHAVFEQWLPGNDDDLESLITLGRLEFDNA